MVADTIQIFDGHNDVLLRLYEGGRDSWRSFFERGEQGRLNLPRAREGGLGGGFFAVFVPDQPDAYHPTQAEPPPVAEGYDRPLPPPLEWSYAQQTAITMSSLLFWLEAESAGQLKVVHTTTQLEACLRDGVLAAILHFEGAEAIGPNLEGLEFFYRAGLRSLGPVWSRPNAFAHGVPFRYPATPDTGPGLTDAGKELVRACNRLGIMIDLSHMNERGFWDVAALSDAPLVATHSNVHALCATTRNLTDKQLDAIKESEGMIGLNFNVGFLRADGKNDPNTPLDTLAQHLDYLVDRVGIECVGLGSDFDGAKMPLDLPDAASLPKFIALLRDRGYDDTALLKIAHQNWLRILQKTWRG